ncbi:hypothetical protein BLL42_27080 (plasmid) [Pseudomonas frederiksbergensis]|uniref:Uncharacterized protein n=1 Tax=Pseudomonas frederiksbergensis TaxID=104087 RepID=A0A1J0ETB2_9PSED|nr:hypothetical protein [Pseudomonas frederiksbergensis]APC19405.1 hypothetical protein BLL42_27080 [Pseudomonas frederiksbergensis]
MSNQKIILLLSLDDQSLLASTLLRVVNSPGDADGRVKALLDEIQAIASPIEILSAAKENGLEFSQCVRAFGEESESNAFAVAARNNYCMSSEDEIEIDDRGSTPQWGVATSNQEKHHAFSTIR